jgi:sulfur carrier protein
MKLHINGEERTFADPPPAELTLTALIESLNMKSDRVAIELNREIAPRDRWPQTLLKDGDRLEIVHFVGGGCSVEERRFQRCDSALLFNCGFSR